MTDEPSALPSAVEAERTILGAVLLDGASFRSAAEHLTAADFYLDAHRRIFGAMAELAEDDAPLDLVTLKHALTRRQLLEAVGGAGYLAGLLDGLPRITQLEQWARMVRDAAVRRNVIQAAHRIAHAAQQGEDTTTAILEQAIKALGDLAMGGSGSDVVSIMDVLPAAVERIDAFMAAQDGLIGISTGLVDLDRLTSGMKPDELWIIAARPSRGKSALLLQMALHAASTGKRGLVFSMEMPPPQFVARGLFHVAEVDRWDLKRDTRRDLATTKLAEARRRLSTLPLWFDRREAPTAAQIRATARQQQVTRGLDFVVVDYLQRCSLAKGAVRDWVGVGEIALQLKGLARALQVPVIAACQVGADAEEKRPTMGDLAQARQIIGAEADLIAFLHPDEPAKWREQSFPAFKLFVDKQRDGETGALALHFERKWTKFVAAGHDPREFDGRTWTAGA